MSTRNQEPRANATFLVSRARHYVDVGSKATNLEPSLFVPCVVGLAAGLLLAFASLFYWYGKYLKQGDLPLSWEAYRGISYPEAKWIFLLGAPASAWVILGIMKRDWLATGLLAAGAAGTFSAVILWALRARIHEAHDRLETEMHQLLGMMGAKDFSQIFWGGATFALTFAWMMATTAAIAFAISALRQPYTLPFLRRPEVLPLARSYGTLVLVHAGALLTGVILAVYFYE